jgi:hypothetical protein
MEVPNATSTVDLLKCPVEQRASSYPDQTDAVTNCEALRCAPPGLAGVSDGAFALRSRVRAAQGESKC